MWVITKMFCYNGSKRRENYGEFVDESRKNISRLIQIWVISPAEKSSGEVLSIVKSFRDRMSQRRLANSRQAVYPVCAASILLRRSVGCPGNDLIQEKCAGAFHTPELLIIADLDVFESPKQKLLLYTRPLSMNYQANSHIPISLVRRRASTFTVRSKSSITFVNSLSISSIAPR